MSLRSLLERFCRNADGASVIRTRRRRMSLAFDRLEERCLLCENAPPIVDNPGGQSNMQGELVSLLIPANDPEGDPLSYSASGLPPGLSIASDSGLVSGLIDPSVPPASYSVTVTVSDAEHAVDASFGWTVLAPPPPPCLNAEITAVESDDPDGRVPMGFSTYLHAVVTIDGFPDEDCKLAAEYRWQYHMTPLGGAGGPMSEWTEWEAGKYYWGAGFVGRNDAHVEARWLLPDGTYHTSLAGDGVEIMPPVKDLITNAIGYQTNIGGIGPSTVVGEAASFEKTIEVAFEGGYTAEDEIIGAGIEVCERLENQKRYSPDDGLWYDLFFEGDDGRPTRQIDKCPGWSTTTWIDEKAEGDQEYGDRLAVGQAFDIITQTNFVRGRTADGEQHVFLMTRRTFVRVKLGGDKWGLAYVNP
jgi:hypothetical protein